MNNETGLGAVESANDDADDRALFERMIVHAVTAERDYTDGKIATIAERLDGKIATGKQRLDDMDRATALLSETVNRVPTDLQKTVSDIIRLMDERDHRVQVQFESIRTLRIAQHDLSQQAIKDALAAQKESSAVSSSSLDRTISKNAELADQAAKSLGARIQQLSDQQVRTQSDVTAILASKQAVVEQKVDTRGGAGLIFGVVGSAIGVLSLVFSIVLAASRL